MKADRIVTGKDYREALRLYEELVNVLIEGGEPTQAQEDDLLEAIQKVKGKEFRIKDIVNLASVESPSHPAVRELISKLIGRYQKEATFFTELADELEASIEE